MAAEPPRQWRNYLPNTVRAGIRGAIERLPAPVQGLFPAPDPRRQIRELHRQIRAAPERRDELDPGWRVRAGAPHAPADIASRRQYIELEKAFYRVANFDVPRRDRESSENQRAQLAAAIYDSEFEGQEIYAQLYTDISNDDAENPLLIDAMTGRMEAALDHVDLTPLFPENIAAEFVPDEDTLRVYGASAARGVLEAQEGQPVPYGIPPELFPLVGRVNPVEGNINVQPPAIAPIDDTVYNGLPNLGAVRVPEEDPISFTPFGAGEPLLIIQVNGHAFHFKREPLENWLNTRIENNEPLTNPATGLAITMDNLRRGTALLGNAGGRRRARQTRRRKRRSTTRRSGRRAQ